MISDELSFEEKLWKAFQLALDLCYEGNECVVVRDTDALYGKRTSELLWAYVDGLEDKYHRRHMEGRCSLQATINYDVAKEEAKIDKHIVQFEALLRKGAKNVEDRTSVTPAD